MAAGCRTAARLSRLSPDYKITVVEKGPYISFSSCGLPLYAEGEIDGISDLTKTSYGAIRDEEYFRNVKGVTVLTKTEVDRIDTTKNEVRCRDLDNGGGVFVLPYDYLVIATGAETVKPKFSNVLSPKISPFHSPSDAENFRKVAQKGGVGKAVIIGGGFVGCELIEALSSLWGIETVLVEKEDALLPGALDTEIATYLQSRIGSDKVQLLLSKGVERIDTDKNGSPVVVLDDGQRIETDYVFYCLGVKPNVELARKANVRTGERGGIVVDEKMRTSVRNVWAAGDCVEIKNLITDKPECLSFGSLSNRMGRVAADSIAGREASFRGAVGTVSLKLFDEIVCAAGLTEKRAKKLGYDAASVLGSFPDRPDYHPESKMLIAKLVYEKRGMRLLGLQLVGEGEVTRYIDVFSELLADKKTVAELLELEHAYTPAHSSPISPLNSLGFMAYNQETDGMRNVSPYDARSFEGTFIDVREPAEVESLPFPEESVRIPLSELHSKLDEFDTDTTIMFVCERGPRAYEAARAFLKHGHKNVSYLGGGNLLYDAICKSRVTNADTEMSTHAVQPDKNLEGRNPNDKR